MPGTLVAENGSTWRQGWVQKLTRTKGNHRNHYFFQIGRNYTENQSAVECGILDSMPVSNRICVFVFNWKATILSCSSLLGKICIHPFWTNIHFHFESPALSIIMLTEQPGFIGQIHISVIVIRTVGSLNADILRYNADILSTTLKLWGKLDESVSWVNTSPSLSPISLHFIR